MTKRCEDLTDDEVENLSKLTLRVTRATQAEFAARGVRLTPAQIEAVAGTVAAQLIRKYLAGEAFAPPKPALNS
jgi:hypothetical protein